MIVHVVLAGEYDDEHIVGVWRRPEEAAQHVAHEQAKPKDRDNSAMVIEAWPVGGGGERISFRYFKHPADIWADELRRREAAQKVYDAKRERYGSPADGTAWLEKMSNRFKHRPNWRNP